MTIDLPSVPSPRDDVATLEDALIARGGYVVPTVACPRCGTPSRSFEIVAVDDIPDDDIPGAWACATCRLDQARRTQSREETSNG